MKLFGCNKFFLATVATATTLVQGSKDDSIVTHSNVRGGIPFARNTLEEGLVGVGANQSSSSAVVRGLQQTCDEDPNAFYDFRGDVSCGNFGGGTGTVFASTTDICEGTVRDNGFEVITGSGPKDPLKVNNANCCVFGFDSGIKVYNNGECGDNGSFPDKTFCTGNNGWSIRVSCADANQITVTFPDGFNTKDGEFMVFRKSGSPNYPAPYVQCGLLSRSGSTTLSFDNGEQEGNPNFVGGAQATSHVDICWNAPEDDPCDARDTECADYEYDPNHPNVEADGCYLKSTNGCQENPDCLSNAHLCSSRPEVTCQEWVCSPNTPGVEADGCLLTNIIGGMTCRDGDCGEGTCIDGACSAVTAKNGLCTGTAPECQKNVCDPVTYVCSPENDNSLSCGDSSDECTMYACQDGSCVPGFKADGVTCTGGCCNGSGGCSTCISTCNCDAPELTGVPVEPITFECGTVLPVYDVTASLCDGTAPPVEVVTTPTPNEPGCSWVITKTWSAENCADETVATRAITVSDTVGPEIVVVPEYDLQCDADLVEPTFSDCTGVDVTQISHSSVPIVGDELRPSYCRTDEVTWVVYDVCENQSTKKQSVTRTKTAPTLLQPGPLEFSCELTAAQRELLISKPVVQDICGADSDTIPTILVEEPEDPGAPVNCRDLVRTWTATDLCEQNANTVEQKITIFDRDPPVAEALGSLTESCLKDVPTVTDPTVTDNCQEIIGFTNFAETLTQHGCVNKATIVRAWTFADDCGNEGSTSQTITVNDNQGPDLATFSSDPDILCPNSEIPIASIKDACDDENVSKSFVKQTLIPKIGDTDDCKLPVTWTFTDQCDNVSEKVHTLTVLDSNPPALPLDDIGPPELNLKCGIDDTRAPPIGPALDTCDGDVTVPLPGDGTKDFQSIPGYVFTRTWTVQDQCGNVNSFPQTINVYDHCKFPVSEAFSGVDIGVTVTIENKIGGGVIFTISVDDGMEGDLRGFFFRLVNGVPITVDDITGDEEILTAKVVDLKHDLIRISNDVTMQGDGNQNRFTAAVAIGRQGLRGGSDDYQTFTFEVAGITTDDIEGNVGIRLTSVTDGQGGREESSKIIGAVVCCRNDSTDPPTPPPPACVATEATCCPTVDEGCGEVCSTFTCPEEPVQCPAACVCNAGDATAACAAERRTLSGMFW